MASELSAYAMQTFQDGEVYHGWRTTSDNVTANVGYAYSGANWVMRIRIDVPTPMSALILHFCNHGSTYNSSDTVMRYAFVDIAEEATYNNATSATPGEGTITIEGGSYAVTDVTIKKVLPAGRHYLYLWTNKSTSYKNNYQRIRWYTNSDGYGSYVQYEELQGAVRIGDGSTFGTYLAEIGNSSSFDLHLAYVGDGTNWNLYTG